MKKWLGHTNSMVLSIAAVGIFILLTLFLRSLGGFQLDLTAGKQYTLSDQTLTTIQGVKEDVRLIAFTVSTSQNQKLNRDVTDMLNEYAKRNKKLKVEQYDLNQEPILAKQYSVTAASIVLVQGEKKRVIDIGSLFTQAQGSGEGAYQFTGEEKLTSGLLALSSTRQGKMVFLTGHEEIPLSQMTELSSSLAQDNVKTEEVQLNQAGSVPKDASVLAIVGPERDISATELKSIRTYLNDGGKLFMALGFHPNMGSNWKNLDALATDYGVKDTHAIVVDQEQTNTLGPLWTVPTFGSHAITDKLAASNLYPVLSLSIALQAGEQKDWKTTLLMKSSAASYGETNIQGLLNNETQKDDKDPQGPLDLGYAVEGKDGKPKAVILGTSALLSDTEISTGGNRDFVLNSLNYVQEHSDGLTIRPRQEQDFKVAYLTAAQAKTVLAISVVGLPLLFAVIGILLWWRRKSA
ncbi:GldG family protein [Paenibacillus sp. M-152]|uniref:GldG family protein n=1 Tax=Paenibacillus sp. M-152 TaxID=2487928 RepID=UPI000F6D7F7F|nr:GldG family protein [Paenibacillus sp. M-152]AZH30930.1 ABC transporter [Paenibacillus sp. M-152]